MLITICYLYVACGTTVAFGEQIFTKKERTFGQTALRFLGYPTFGLALCVIVGGFIVVCWMVGFIVGAARRQYRKGYAAATA